MASCCGDGEVAHDPWSSWVHAGTCADGYPRSVPSLTLLPGLRTLLSAGVSSSPNHRAHPELLPTTQRNTQLHTGVLAPSASLPTPESEATFSVLPGPSSPPGHRLLFSESLGSNAIHRLSPRLQNYFLCRKKTSLQFHQAFFQILLFWA